MCLAVPGKIVQKRGDKVVVDYGDQQIEAGIMTGEFKEGDYVIVQGRVVIEKVPMKQVKHWEEFVKSSS